MRWLGVTPSEETEVGLANRLDIALLGAPATKVTKVVSVTPAKVAVTVLPSACVEARVAVNVPDASVVPLAGATVLALPLLLRTTL